MSPFKGQSDPTGQREKSATQKRVEYLAERRAQQPALGNRKVSEPVVIPFGAKAYRVDGQGRRVDLKTGGAPATNDSMSPVDKRVASLAAQREPDHTIFLTLPGGFHVHREVPANFKLED